MKRSSKALGLTMALLISAGAIAGCSPKGTEVPGTTTADTVKLQGSTAAVQVQEALLGVHDDEMTYADAENVMGSDFTTKAIGDAIKPQVTTVVTDAKEKASATATQVAASAGPKVEEAKAKLQEKATTAKANATKYKKQIEESGAVKVNADGSVTINPTALKQEAQKIADEVKANTKKKLEAAKEKLQAVKEVAQEKLKEVRRVNNVVRTSEVVTTPNADGSTTYTTTVNFENKKVGITRETVVSKTKSKEGKVIRIEHSFKMTAPNLTKEGTRLVVINPDGTKTVKTQTLTKYNAGGSREVNEERVVAADGTATGNGTVTVTDKDGKATTYNLNLSVSASAEVTTTATDTATKTEVSVDQKTDGTATATVKEDTKESATTVNVAAAAEASAAGTATTAPAASPAPAASASASPAAK